MPSVYKWKRTAHYEVWDDLEMMSLDTGEVGLTHGWVVATYDITVFYSSENALSFIKFQFKDAILSHRNKWILSWIIVKNEMDQYIYPSVTQLSS